MPRTRLLLFVALVFVARTAWPQGNPLGPEFRVNIYTTSGQAYPSVASDSFGNFVVVWSGTMQDGSGAGVLGQRYASSGMPLGPEFRVNTYTTGNQYIPAVASDANGNFTVVWNSNGQDGSSFGVFGQRYASSGGPLGPEFRVNTATTGGQAGPSVSSDPAGNFVVVWTAGAEIVGQRYASSGMPLGSEFPVNTSTTGCPFVTGVASDSAGNFVVAWQDEAGNGGYCPGTGIFGRRYTSAGIPLDAPFRVNTYTTGLQGSASVASDAAGNFVVVWMSPQKSGSSGIFGQRYSNSGAPIGPEFPVNTYTTGFQGLPDVALDGSGNFVVVWSSGGHDGSSYGIFGQRYTDAGTPLGPEFRVNTYTTDTQLRPSVAADLAGNFVVAWQSYTQDGSSWGVFGQRYGRIVPVELMRFGIE